MVSMRTKFLFGCLFVWASLALAQSSPAPDSISAIFSADGVAEPLQASSASTSFQYIIAHWQYGQGYSTQAMLANSGTETATVKVQFFNQAGASFAVPLTGGSKSSDTLKISPGNVMDLSTQSSDRANSSLDVAWGIATSNAPLNVFTLLDEGTSASAITGVVGLPAAPAASSFRFPVTVGGPEKFDARVAIANPSKSTATVTVMVLNANGTTMGTFPQTLAANHQTIFTLDSSTTGLNFSSFGTTPFVGSVAVCSSEPIGLVAIGLEGSEFYSTSVTNDPCP